MTALSQARLRRDLDHVVAQVQDLVHRVGDSGADTVNGLRDRMSQAATVARDRWTLMDGAVRDNARYAARATDQFVHDNPWRAIGVGAALGLLLGYLASRR